MEVPDVSQPMEESNDVSNNRAILWGVLGITIGVIVATSVRFRAPPDNRIGGVLSPFREEE